MSESDPTPTPSSAAAAASSSPGSTSSARASQKATKRRRSAIGGMACVVAVVILLWAAVLTIPMSNGVLYFFYGGASGASVVMLVYIALIIAKRRGHDTFAVRGLERRKDERDRATSQRAWALAGVVGLFGNVVVGAVGAFGGVDEAGPGGCPVAPAGQLHRREHLLQPHHVDRGGVSEPAAARPALPGPPPRTHFDRIFRIDPEPRRF